MEYSRKILLAKVTTVMAIIPAAIVAHSMGAPERVTGAPGEGTCAQATCHIGTAVNAGGGKVEVSYSGGTSWTTGQKGTFTVTITDSAAKVYGFEASPRLASNLQAGTITPGTAMFVQCQDGRIRATTCSSLEFVTHTTPKSTGSFQFDWTPPAAGAGNVVVYVAGNAANGNGNADSGDHIYTANITLTEAVSGGGGGGGARPAVSSSGIVNSWSAQQGVATNTWISIFGTSLSGTTRDWTGSTEFAQGKLPTSLDGVSVTVGGKSAPVYYVSPTQVNALVPSDDATGSMAVVVKNSSGESTPVTVTRTALLPSLLTVPQSDGRLLVVGRLNSNPNMVLGLPAASSSRPFQPGDVVQFYATGLGPTTPSIAADTIVSSPATLNNTPAIRINNVPAEIIGSALVSSGLYQINARFPDVPNGEQPVVVEIGGVRSPDGAKVLVAR